MRLARASQRDVCLLLFQVLLAFAPQRGAVHAKHLRRFVQAGRTGDYTQDVLALDGVQRAVAAELQFRPGRPRNALRQGAGLKRWARPDDDGAFHRVAQFADIARPCVIQQ